MTSKVTYKGQLHTEALHLSSGAILETDAPKDNNGKGEGFSPTDLTATSLATCMLTVMGIAARKENMTAIDGTVAEVTKVMVADPRRIGEVHVQLSFPKAAYTEREKKIYEHTAHTCPVAKSLHPDIKQVITFVWP